MQTLKHKGKEMQTLKPKGKEMQDQIINNTTQGFKPLTVARRRDKALIAMSNAAEAGNAALARRIHDKVWFPLTRRYWDLMGVEA